MRRVLVSVIAVAVLAFFARRADAQAGAENEVCAAARAGDSLVWLPTCDLPEEGAYLKCYSTTSGGKKCWLYQGPIDRVRDANGDELESSSAPIFEIRPGTTQDWTRGTSGVAIFDVITTYEPPIIDDAWLAGKGALTSQSGGEMNAAITIGSGGKFEDTTGREHAVGYCWPPIRLEDFTLNVGSKKYYRWSGGASVGSQDLAEALGLNAPGGFVTIGWIPRDSSTDAETALPSSNDVTLGITIDNTDATAVCTFTNAEGADGDTCAPSNRFVATSNYSGLWLECASCASSSTYDIDLLVCVR